MSRKSVNIGNCHLNNTGTKYTISRVFTSNADQFSSPFVKVTPIFDNLVHPLEVIDVSTFANYNPKFAEKELYFDKAPIFCHSFRISKK